MTTLIARRSRVTVTGVLWTLQIVSAGMFV